MAQTLDQRIAASAHTQVTTLMKRNIPELPGRIKKTATRMRVSGLGVTIAFCQKDEELKAIAGALSQILADLKLPNIKTDQGASLLEAYRTGSSAEVRRLQTHAEQALEWLAKWADSSKKNEQKA